MHYREMLLEPNTLFSYGNWFNTILFQMKSYSKERQQLTFKILLTGSIKNQFYTWMKAKLINVILKSFYGINDVGVIYPN